MGRAGIEPATLGLKGGCWGLGESRSSWKAGDFDPISAVRSRRVSVGLVAPMLPHKPYAPHQAPREAWSNSPRPGLVLDLELLDRRSLVEPAGVVIGPYPEGVLTGLQALVGLASAAG